jgi:small subunit ribosomal protein S18
MKQNRRQLKRIIVVPRDCEYCNNSILPDYKEVQTILKFTTERGKIIPKSRNGLCSRHQRQVTKAIQYARFMAMIPFVVRA